MFDSIQPGLVTATSPQFPSISTCMVLQGHGGVPLDEIYLGSTMTYARIAASSLEPDDSRANSGDLTSRDPASEYRFRTTVYSGQNRGPWRVG